MVGAQAGRSVEELVDDETGGDAMTATAVRSKQLVKRYGDVPALGPLDLAIDRGQRVSLVGHNGSGKTTLIRLLTGRIDPSDGSAEVAGSDPGSIEARSALSYLADQPVFYDDLSLLEHLEFVARLHGREEWRDRADELLEQVGLTDRADDLPITFSRGLKQKAAICIAFIRPFEVLVVDEPFVGLDAHGREALLALFDAAHADGKTLLVATHELATVKASERLVALSDGALRYDGPPDVDVNELVDG
jgi:ABC-type multidrug transport system ATPase subunit